MKKLEEEKDSLENIRRNLLQRQLSLFDEKYILWNSAINAISELDALLSLSISSSLGGALLVTWN